MITYMLSKMAQDIWRTHQYVGIILLTLSISIYFGKKYSWLIGASLFYAFFSCLFVFMNPVFYYGKLGHAIGVSGAKVYVSILLPILFLEFFKRKWVYDLIDFILLIDCVLIIYNGYGIFNVASMDASIIAAFYPAMILRLRDQDMNKKMFFIFTFLLVFLPLVAIFLSKGTTAYLILMTGIFFIQIKRKKYLSALILTTLVFLIGVIYVTPDKFFEPNGRFTEWAMFMNWWKANANIWVGTGAGSFEWIGPLIENRNYSLFLFLHNDFLQIAFEYGLLGFFLFIGVFLSALKKSLSVYNNWLFPCLMNVSVLGFFQFPLRFFLSQFIIVLLIYEAYTSYSKKY